jgi:hypothetical protein
MPDEIDDDRVDLPIMPCTAAARRPPEAGFGGGRGSPMDRSLRPLRECRELLETDTRRSCLRRLTRMRAVDGWPSHYWSAGVLARPASSPARVPGSDGACGTNTGDADGAVPSTKKPIVKTGWTPKNAVIPWCQERASFQIFFRIVEHLKVT